MANLEQLEAEVTELKKGIEIRDDILNQLLGIVKKIGEKSQKDKKELMGKVSKKFEPTQNEVLLIGTIAVDAIFTQISENLAKSLTEDIINILERTRPND